MDESVRPGTVPRPSARGRAAGPVATTEQRSDSRSRPAASPVAGGEPDPRRRWWDPPADARRGSVALSPPIVPPGSVLIELFRPLAVAAANAARRSRVEVTVYASDGRVEGTAWFGVPAHEQVVVARLIAGWPSANPPMAFDWSALNGTLTDRGRGAGSGVVGGTRPPAPIAERSTDSALPADLRGALTAVGRDLALVVPLVDRGVLVGRLSVWSPGDGRPLAQAALLAVVALSEQAGLTIRAARRLAANGGEHVVASHAMPGDPLVSLAFDLEAALVATL